MNTQQNNNYKGYIVTIMVFAGLQPYAVRTLKPNERYAQEIARFKTEEAAIEAVKKLEALGATTVTPYHFAKTVSSY